MGLGDGQGGDGERERICAALLTLIRERGYSAIHRDLLLRRADVSEEGFGRHFSDLQDCYAAIWEEIDEELERRMSSAYQAGGEWSERLRGAMRAALTYLATEEDRGRLYVGEAVYVDDVLRERQRQSVGRLSALIDRGRMDSDTAPEFVAEAISGAIWRRVGQLLRSGRGAELPAQLPLFMYFAVLPYLGSAAAQAELRRAGAG
jgi:AcrR family transcriptional regulator